MERAVGLHRPSTLLSHMHILLHLLFILPEINKTHDTKHENELKSISQIQNTKTGDRDSVSATRLPPTTITISMNETWQRRRGLL